MQSLLSQTKIAVYDRDGDTLVFNATETEAAREKARALQERFGEWVWEDPERTARLVEEYNRRFNGLRLRTYDHEGEHLTLPGLARTFTPRPHQRAAVARMVSEPAVGLFHQVGAGKTAEMVMGAMELRRLGMARKPCVVVPNHMLEQVTREWLQLYPQARLLAAGAEDLQGDKRRQFVARAATNDWDAVVLTQGAFYRIPVGPDGIADYMGTELALQRDRLERARDAGKDLTIKRLEKAVLRQEERLKERMDGPKDAGIYFDQTGIDYVVVDEAHLYKNLATVSNISDAAIDGSQRATDLHMKLELLRGRHGDRVVTMATATPIANGIAEAHVMQRYLRPDVLRDAGVEDFDAWAATFGEQVTEMEMKAGGGWSEKTRLARYQNVPELLAMWQVFADVKTAEDLKLPVPAIRERPDGRRWADTVSIPPSPQLQAFMAWIAREAEVPGGRDDPAKMLRLYMQGRAAALDMRLISPELAPPASVTTKLDVVADRIADIYDASKDTVYLDDAGEPSEIPGALQLVFCDLSTPGDGWNAYDQLHRNLVHRGLPADKIRFIHDARNDAEKARLFAACRAGHVAVLVGSTAKMGVGHQRPEPGHRPTRRRLPLAARRPRATVRPDPAAGQPEPGNPALPLRRRRIVRHRRLPGRRAQTTGHHPDHARPPGRPGDRRRRRRPAVHGRNQSHRLRRPAHHGKSPDGQGNRPPRATGPGPPEQPVQPVLDRRIHQPPRRPGRPRRTPARAGHRPHHPDQGRRLPDEGGPGQHRRPHRSRAMAVPVPSRPLPPPRRPARRRPRHHRPRRRARHHRPGDSGPDHRTRHPARPRRRPPQRLDHHRPRRR